MPLQFASLNKGQESETSVDCTVSYKNDVSQEAVDTPAAPMETLPEVSEPSASVAASTKSNEGPKVISMDAVSVPDGSQMSAEIQAMLDNMHTDPYSEDEVSVLLGQYAFAC